MLLLTRRPTETIVAGEVTITVVRSSVGRVTIGIDAPQETKILRGELVDRDEQPKQEAA